MGNYQKSLDQVKRMEDPEIEGIYNIFKKDNGNIKPKNTEVIEYIDQLNALLKIQSKLEELIEKQLFESKINEVDLSNKQLNMFFGLITLAKIGIISKELLAVVLPNYELWSSSEFTEWYERHNSKYERLLYEDVD
ncbi:hypothetical protein M2M59_07385 [Rummeliibacillus sp. G93]|uniref:hypothetical protein n=1 Tax=Rummeliibacillus sp. G93 TaxID=2939494 RepID=UPI00201BE608|nr:hypothetical protein [Rummeliibacillus sp. G93]UQW98828.1 hypothetical protein M2M59_07385 [Rummeliibacillus sp. G93]